MKASKDILNFSKIITFKFYKDVILEQKSPALIDKRLPPLTQAVFLHYISIWLLMSTFSDYSQSYFWLTTVYNEKIIACPYNFKDKMNKKGFDEITRELRSNNLNPLACCDQFF